MNQRPLGYECDPARETGRGQSTRILRPRRVWNGKTLNQAALTLYRQGKYEQAVATEKKALEVAERDHGPEHPLVGTSLNNLAEYYRAQGRNAAAEPAADH